MVAVSRSRVVVAPEQLAGNERKRQRRDQTTKDNVEGQRGGLRTIPKLELLVLSFDASVSMTVDKYKAALTYVLDLLQRHDIYEQIGIVFWGSSYEVVKPVSLYGRPVYDLIKTRWSCQGGTMFDNAIKPFVYTGLKGHEPDLMIVFTDGQFYKDYDTKSCLIDPKCKSWYNSSRRSRVLYVLTPDGEQFKNNIHNIDPTSKNRIVVMPCKK